MNNIKPQWIILGTFFISILWLTELANRPDNIPEYSETAQLFKSKASQKTLGKVTDSVVTRSADQPVPVSTLTMQLSPPRALNTYSRRRPDEGEPFSQPLKTPLSKSQTLSKNNYLNDTPISEY